MERQTICDKSQEKVTDSSNRPINHTKATWLIYREFVNLQIQSLCWEDEI